MSWLKMTMKWGGIALLGLFIAGAVYQQIGAAIDRRTEPPGQMLTVDGHAVRVLCSGQGDTTFVLDAGLGAWSFEWFRIQPVLAKTARVCAIDRPGLGGSEPRNDGFDAGSAADVMAKIVHAAGIRRPFIYVGHSLGANFAEVYAAKYPRDIAGVVLLEPGVPQDLLEDFGGTRTDAMALTPCGTGCVLGWIAGVFGAPRIAVPLLGVGHKSMGDQPDVLASYRTGLARTDAPAMAASFLEMVPKTAYQCDDLRSFDALPLLVIASSRPREPDSGESEADLSAWRKRQLAYFKALAAKSTRGAGPVVIANSTHTSMTMGPAAGGTAAAILAFAQKNGLLPVRH